MRADEARERPILFSGPMVRAILDGTKTQTRRVVKPQPQLRGNHGDDCVVTIGRQVHSGPTRYMLDRLTEFGCPYGVPGDRLWVREAWGCPSADHPAVKDGRKPTIGDRIVYRANKSDAWQWRGGLGCADFVWRPSIHMPRWASRLTLTITDVRVERVQDMSEADAIAEGINTYVGYARERYRDLWNTLNRSRGYGWDANPWVWVLTFTRASA